MKLPKLYPILDAGFLETRGLDLCSVAEQMRTAGVSLIQYRDKTGPPQTILRNAAAIREEFLGTDCKLILNDRADLAVLAAWDGVHIGQGDLAPEDARRVVGGGPGGLAARKTTSAPHGGRCRDHRRAGVKKSTKRIRG